jgi:hypothetical protein
MANVTPLVQPPVEDIRNALQIAQLWVEANPVQRFVLDAPMAMGDIARLLKHALEGLSEPSLAAVQATEILMREWHGTPDGQRSARDTAAGILWAQLTGAVPPTWKAP